MFFQVMLHLNVLMLPIISAYEFFFFISCLYSSRVTKIFPPFLDFLFA